MALIYRRLVLIAGARAEVQPLARAWGVIIRGVIGHNGIKVLETYNLRREARNRRVQINEQHAALVVSVEEILYPLAYVFAKFDTAIHKNLPPMPPPSPIIEAYSQVHDVYGLQRQFFEDEDRSKTSR